jgi:hypothetical protein
MQRPQKAPDSGPAAPHGARWGSLGAGCRVSQAIDNTRVLGLPIGPVPAPVRTTRRPEALHLCPATLYE